MSLDGPDVGLSRRRALQILGGLAVVAVLLVGLMVFFLDSGGGSNHRAALPATQVSPTGKASTFRPPASSPPPNSSSSSSSSSSAPAGRSSSSSSGVSGPTTTSCPTAKACTLQGDSGQALAALNAFRAKHHKAAVGGSVSAAAQSCAVHNGDGPSCSASYFWEPVSSADGQSVVSKIATKKDGLTWLLDTRLKSVTVGWAFVPAAHGAGGVYECAVFANY